MPRTSRNASLDEIIRRAVEPVVARAAAAIARTMAELSAERVSQRVASGRRKQRPRSRPKTEMTEWTADRRARRVPKFVIEATGLDTKKKIVAKFGDGVTFHKGKPLPTPRRAASERKTVAAPAIEAARQVKARPPRIRKAAGV